MVSVSSIQDLKRASRLTELHGLQVVFNLLKNLMRGPPLTSREGLGSTFYRTPSSRLYYISSTGADRRGFCDILCPSLGR